MKNNNQFGFILKWVAIGCLMAWSRSSYAAEVVIKARIAPPKAGITVYKMETPLMTKERLVDRCAKILEISGFKSFSREMMKPVEDRMVISGKEIEVSMNNNGTEFFYSNFPALKLTEKTGRLLADEQAIKLARNYLNNTGLIPRNQKELKIDHIGGIMQMLSNARVPEKKAVVVYFNRELDGLKVRNFGSSITVTLAESEIPVGVQYHWREVASREKVSSRSLLGTEKVMRLIREDVNRVFSKEAKVIIDKIELVLYDNGGNYIQPAYCYQGVRKSEGKGFADMPVLGYVPVLEKVYEPITHPAYSPLMKSPIIRIEKPVHDQDE
jgi:hypothetical protein